MVIANAQRFDGLNKVCARPIIDLITIKSNMISVADDPLGDILTNTNFVMNYNQGVSDACFFKQNESDPIYGNEIDPCVADCLCGGLPNRNTYDTLKCSTTFSSVRRYKTAIALSECRCPTLDGFNITYIQVLYNIMRGLYLGRYERIMKAIYSSSYVCTKNKTGSGSITSVVEFFDWTKNPIFDAGTTLFNKDGVEELVYTINGMTEEVSDARERYNASTMVIIVDQENFVSIRNSMRQNINTGGLCGDYPVNISNRKSGWKYLYLPCSDILVVSMPKELFKVTAAGKPFFPIFPLNALSAAPQRITPKVFTGIGESIGANGYYSNEFAHIATLANHNDPDYDGAAKIVAWWGNVEIKANEYLFSYVLGKAFTAHNPAQEVNYTGTPTAITATIAPNPVFTKVAT